MNRHTPGPWHLKIDPPTLNGYQPHTWIQATADNGWKGDCYLSVSGICEQGDAYMLVSAPEMLAALRAFIEAHDLAETEPDQMLVGLQMGCAYEMARNAIAKATGEGA